MDRNTDENAQNKKYSCDVCEFRTNYRSSLLRHVNSTHGKIKRGKSIFTCSATRRCKYKTTNSNQLRRHMATVHDKVYSCQHCEFKTNNKKILEKHKIQQHRGKSRAIHSCGVCKLAFTTRENFQQHLDEAHPEDEDFKLVNSAFKKSLRIYSKHLRLKTVDTSCLWEILPNIKRLCQRILSSEFATFTLNVSFYGIFEKLAPVENNDDMETETFPLKTTRFLIRPNVRYGRIMRSMIRQLDDHIENLLNRGSGWVCMYVMCSLLIIIY